MKLRIEKNKISITQQSSMEEETLCTLSRFTTIGHFTVSNDSKASSAEVRKHPLSWYY